MPRSATFHGHNSRGAGDDEPPPSMRLTVRIGAVTHQDVLASIWKTRVLLGAAKPPNSQPDKKHGKRAAKFGVSRGARELRQKPLGMMTHAD